MTVKKEISRKIEGKKQLESAKPPFFNSLLLFLMRG